MPSRECRHAWFVLRGSAHARTLACAHRYHIHLSAFRNGGARVERALLRSEAGSSGPYINAREVCMAVELEPGAAGALTLVASTYSPGECASFTVSAHSQRKVELARAGSG